MMAVASIEVNNLFNTLTSTMAMCRSPVRGS